MWSSPSLIYHVIKGKPILVVLSQSAADRSGLPSLRDKPFITTTWSVHLYQNPLVRNRSETCSQPWSDRNSPEVISSSRDGVDGALQVLWSWEDGVRVDDDSFNELIDVGLARNLVMAFWDRHQRGAETDGQVVGVHHIVLAVLRQAGGVERWVTLTAICYTGIQTWLHMQTKHLQCMNTRLSVCTTSMADNDGTCVALCLCLNECTWITQQKKEEVLLFPKKISEPTQFTMTLKFHLSNIPFLTLSWILGKVADRWSKTGRHTNETPAVLNKSFSNCALFTLIVIKPAKLGVLKWRVGVFKRT